MSTDSDVTADLMQVLEDGKHGYAKGAEKLTDTKRPDLAQVFQGYTEQRATFVTELQELARSYGDQISESGTIVASLHRGWMSLKDALAGSSPTGVLDTAEQGEDHAVKAYDEALKADLSAGLRTVVARQADAVKAAHDRIKSLRETEG
jgi:uncharacterized protein (TIGR02284 family)